MGGKVTGIGTPAPSRHNSIPKLCFHFVSVFSSDLINDQLLNFAFALFLLFSHCFHFLLLDFLLTQFNCQPVNFDFVSISYISMKWKKFHFGVLGIFHRGEREFPFPSIPKNESLWFPFPNYGNGFFHSLPVPEFRECFFFIPFPFPNYGNGFFHSLPELWECIFFIPEFAISQTGIKTGIGLL